LHISPNKTLPIQKNTIFRVFPAITIVGYILGYHMGALAKPVGQKVVSQHDRSVYMDANATTPLLPEVFEAMRPWLTERCGNASSRHAQGRAARTAIELARQQVAGLIGCSQSEVIFTSGGTEADNLAIFGVVTEPGAHVITTRIEHHAVLHAVARLKQRGCAVSYVSADLGGQVSPDDVRRAIRPNTRLISVMTANNETGVLQPVEEIGRISREHGIPFHTDAVQAAGKTPIDVEQIGCDLLSISGHKMNGPQGAGALFVRRGVEIEPQMYGGGHERGMRSGTENVAGIVGLGAAAEIAQRGLSDGSLKKMERLRDELERSLLLEAEDAGVNGVRTVRVWNTTNIWFGGVVGSRLLRLLDERGVAVSGGSACNAGQCEPSHVLMAMGLSMGRAASSVRFSLSKQATTEDVDFVIWQVCEVLERLKRASNRAAREHRMSQIV
jgi:cysteine desulfurase